MTPAASLSPDAQVIVLACSALASKGDRSLKPLTAAEWHELTVALRNSNLKRPHELARLDGAAIRTALGTSEELSDRLAGLISRGGQLAMELERLASRGIWVLTRADDDYPAL